MTAPTPSHSHDAEHIAPEAPSMTESEPSASAFADEAMSAMPETLRHFWTSRYRDIHAEPGTLYLVPTPIGNLGDLSVRAAAILATADRIACEDTRHSGQLLHVLGIRRPLISYHEHNRAKRLPELLAMLRDGEALALVSDAGMPAISDPGQDLVRACRDEGLPVIALPGPNAAITAVAASGLPTERFTFFGFLPVKGRERREALTALYREALLAPDASLILYEAPHRLLQTLRDLIDTGFARCPAAVLREISKRHESCHRGTVEALLHTFEATPPRGEIVLVMTGQDLKVDVPDTPHGKIGSAAPSPTPVESVLEEALQEREAPDPTRWHDVIDAKLQEGMRPTALVKALLQAPPAGAPPLTRNALYELVQTRKRQLSADDTSGEPGRNASDEPGRDTSDGSKR